MKSIWVPVSGQIAQQKKIDTIANNIANANTTAFKKDQLAFKEYLTALDKGIQDIDLPDKEWAPEDFYRSYGAQNSQVRVDGSYTSFQQGQISPTRNPFDLAVQGPGFFEVLTPRGIRYSRGGELVRNDSNQLVDGSGNPLLLRPQNAQAPASRRIVTLPDAAFTVSPQGVLFSGQQRLGELSIVEFNDHHALRKEGNSLYANRYPDNLREASATQIIQGALEKSNVNAVEEMSQLIKAHRHFESIQNAVKAYDSMNQRAVNDISKF